MCVIEVGQPHTPQPHNLKNKSVKNTVRSYFTAEITQHYDHSASFSLIS